MNPKIKGLGETVLRVRDLENVTTFYAEVIGLELLRKSATVAFFKIAEGFAGHTQILGLFAEALPTAFPHDSLSSIEPSCSSLHHFALEIALHDFDSERERLESLGCEIVISEHSWCQWRSLYVKDPESNVVELVCYDKTIK